MIIKISMQEKDYLFVKHSQISGGGNGLFTTIPIKPGRIIAKYFGELISNSEATYRASQGKNGHFIRIDELNVLDCYDTDGYAKYANDAESFTNPTNFKNNAVLTRVPGSIVPVLVSKRQIYPGEEIFVGYGDHYWEKYSTNPTTKSINGMIWL
jgi:hypothetical protein